MFLKKTLRFDLYPIGCLTHRRAIVEDMKLDEANERFALTVGNAEWRAQDKFGIFSSDLHKAASLFPGKRSELFDLTVGNAEWRAQHNFGIFTSDLQKAASLFPGKRSELFDLTVGNAEWRAQGKVGTFIADLEMLVSIFPDKRSELFDLTAGNAEWRAQHKTYSDDLRELVNIFPVLRNVNSSEGLKLFLTARLAAITVLGIFKCRSPDTRMPHDLSKTIAQMILGKRTSLDVETTELKSFGR